MNRYIFIASLLAAAAAAPTAMADPEADHGDRPIYGFFLSNPGGYTNASADKYGFAKQTFANPASNELLHELSDGIGVYAATAIDGVYYAAPYQFLTSMTMPDPRPLFSYNIYTGQVIEIGDWSDKTSDLKPSDMTYDYKNDRLLAVCYGSMEGSGIYEVSRSTGAMTLLGKLNTTGGVIAADAFGRVFTISVDGTLMQIDVDGDFSCKPLYRLPYQQLASNQSLEFDLTSGLLYWSANTLTNPYNDNGRSTRLIEITLPQLAPGIDYSPDMTGYSCYNIGELGMESRFLGIHIPYATGGFDAPGFAESRKSVSSPDGDFCTLEFAIPARTFGGDPLASVDGYDIFRDGVKIHTARGPFQAGSVQNYDDRSIPVSGKEYRYDIVCWTTTKGDGPKSPVFAYVGLDAPAAVSNPATEVSDDFMTVSLSWTAPAAGQHGGTFDPALTRYDVMRLPDNYKVAENISECTVNDRLSRLLRYSYRITSKNAYGESQTVTREFIAGKPVDELPLEETFDYPNSMALRWTTVDNNNDGLTWLYGTTLGHGVFGDFETTAEYILSPTSVDAFTTDADDWIISPPISFGNDQEGYRITLNIRSLTPEQLNICVGARNTVAGMETIHSFHLRQPQYSDDEEGRMMFQEYAFDLPESVKGKVACVGVQLATPLNEEKYGYIQINDITIDAGKAGVKAIGSDAANRVRIDGDILTIEGSFARAALFNTQGMKAADIKTTTTSLAGLKGIYILVIDGKSRKIAL